MRILAFDTACACCSVALWRDGEVLARESQAMERGHAEALVPMIERVMGAAGSGFANLDRIAVTVGPGSFTGLRVGLATARGLALATGLPVVGVTTFEAFAELWRGVLGPGSVLAIFIDSRRREPFAQLFDADLTALAPPTVLGRTPSHGSSIETIMAGIGGKTIRAAGDGLAAFEELHPELAASFPPISDPAPAPRYPDCAALAAHAARRAPIKARWLTPLYLRAPEARLPAAAS